MTAAPARVKTFLEQGHPELAAALEALPVSPSGPVMEVLAVSSVCVPGNAAATRWTWLVLVDSLIPEAHALIEAISYLGRPGPGGSRIGGFAPTKTDHTLKFESGYIRRGETSSLSARSPIAFRPRNIIITHDEPNWNIGTIRVGGRIRRNFYGNIEVGGQLRIGMVLPWQVVTIQVTRSARSPRMGAFYGSLCGPAKTWTTHQVRETETIEQALAFARPEIRATLAAQL